MDNDSPLLDFASIDNILKLSQLLPSRSVPAAMGPGMQDISVTPMGPGISPQGFPAPVISLPSYAQPHSPSTGAAKVPKVDGTGLDTLRKLIRKAESSDNYQAKNKHTSASGAYQYVNGTWNNYGGYPEARLAPKAVQDAKINEDLARRLQKFAGDPFKIIAAHYLPSFANDPTSWTRPHRLSKKTVVEPTANYVRKVIQGTPLEGQFDAYLRSHGIR